MIAVERYIAFNHVMITNDYKYLNVNNIILLFLSSTDEYYQVLMEKLEIHFSILYVKCLFFYVLHEKKNHHLVLYCFHHNAQQNHIGCPA